MEASLDEAQEIIWAIMRLEDRISELRHRLPSLKGNEDQVTWLSDLMSDIGHLRYYKSRREWMRMRDAIVRLEENNGVTN
jgi:hypothetical protein